MATAAAMCALLAPRYLTAGPNDLNVWFIDVEGGQSTLFVSPSGQSVLIDTGWEERDAKRIMDAVKEAGLKQIDYLIVSHYHEDHVGGVPALSARIPIKNFIDHGEVVEHSPAAQKLYGDYVKEAAKGNRTIAKPGDKLPVKGVDWTIVSSNGEFIANPLPGAGQTNPFWASFQPRRPDASENARAVGSVVQFGKFRLADLADVTWNKEFELMCPVNKLGTADVFVVSHHGMDMSDSPVLVHALRPRVAITDNGEKKGGTAEVWSTVHASPGIEDIWQLHFVPPNGRDKNPDENRLANMTADPDPGFYLKMIAHSDGHFEIGNQRNGYTKKY